MATKSTSELKAFRHFLDRQMENGRRGLTPEECVELWRSEQRERAAANEGIRRGLRDMKAGRGQPLEEFAAEFRKKNNLPRRS